MALSRKTRPYLRRMALASTLAALLAGCGTQQFRKESQAYMHSTTVDGVQGILHVHKPDAQGKVRIHGQVTGLDAGTYALYLDKGGLCGRPGKLKESIVIRPTDGQGKTLPGPMGGAGPTQPRPLVVFAANDDGIGHIDVETTQMPPDGNTKTLVDHSLVVREAFTTPGAKAKGAAIGDQVACGTIEP